jgi:hypothetical protein
VNQVIEIRAAYSFRDEHHADLLLEAEPQPFLALTLIHERIFGDLRVHSFDFDYLIPQQLMVAAGESLTMIGRRDGHIVGCLVNEVDIREEGRILLRPKGGYNLVVYQQRYHDLRQVQGPESCRISADPHYLPTTLLLANLILASQTHYARRRQQLPRAIELLLPAMKEAVKANEEEYSQEMLGLYCVALHELGLDQAERAEQVARLIREAEPLIAVRL